MALLQIKLPEPLFSNQSLKSIFYDHYPTLKRSDLEGFVPLYRAARIMDVSPEHVKAFLIRSKTVKALEAINLTADTTQILIHPDSLIKLLKSRFKRGLKNLYIEH